MSKPPPCCPPRTIQARRLLQRTSQNGTSETVWKFKRAPLWGPMSRENGTRSTLISALRPQKNAIQTRPAIFQTVSPRTPANGEGLGWAGDGTLPGTLYDVCRGDLPGRVRRPILARAARRGRHARGLSKPSTRVARGSRRMPPQPCPERQPTRPAPAAHRPSAPHVKCGHSLASFGGFPGSWR